MSPVLGIDIGAGGALALVFRDGALGEVFDMPILRDGPKGRPTVNASLLAEFVFRSHASAAFIEYVGARPGEGAVGAFAFGRARGVIEGVLDAAGIPVTFISSPSWKRLIGIAPGKDGAKDAARSEAIRRWPDKAALFARVKDDGRAEAALIAVAASCGRLAVSERERLPNRRTAQLFDFEHGGRKWTVCVGRFSDGRVAEVFIDAARDSPLIQLAQDGALAISLALQSGCPLATLRHALSGREAGPLAVALNLIDGGG
jgi:crossover junction endodeoxyribonuclease RuvC